MVPAGYYHDAEGRRRDAGRHPHSTIDAVQPPGTTTGRASLADVPAPGPAAARWLVAAVLAATPFSAGDPGTRRGWEEELARRLQADKDQFEAATGNIALKASAQRYMRAGTELKPGAKV